MSLTIEMVVDSITWVRKEKEKKELQRQLLISTTHHQTPEQRAKQPRSDMGPNPLLLLLLIRKEVRADQIPWTFSWPEYSPNDFTAPSVSAAVNV